MCLHPTMLPATSCQLQPEAFDFPHAPRHSCRTTRGAGPSGRPRRPRRRSQRAPAPEVSAQQGRHLRGWWTASTVDQCFLAMGHWRTTYPVVGSREPLKFQVHFFRGADAIHRSEVWQVALTLLKIGDSAPSGACRGANQAGGGECLAAADWASFPGL